MRFGIYWSIITVDTSWFSGTEFLDCKTVSSLGDIKTRKCICIYQQLPRELHITLLVLTLLFSLATVHEIILWTSAIYNLNDSSHYAQANKLWNNIGQAIWDVNQSYKLINIQLIYNSIRGQQKLILLRRVKRIINFHFKFSTDL
jgi:hypothetical protein